MVYGDSIPNDEEVLAAIQTIKTAVMNMAAGEAMQ